MINICVSYGRLAYAYRMSKRKSSSPPSDQNGKKVGRRSYTPISDALSQPNTLADNEFSEGIARFNLLSLLSQCMKKERRSDGVELVQILMTLLVWPVLNSSSIHCYCSELCQYIWINAKKLRRPADVIYDFWAREDINWRKWACKVSRKVGDKINLGNPEKQAFIVDDTLKARRGKKVEGSSRHFDHNSGTSMQGHQVLELGISGEAGFIPVDQHIYTGECNAIGKTPDKDFKDGRSAAAQDMKRAVDENKHQLLSGMIKRAIKAGHKAAYVLGDAWFGTKANIAMALENGLKAIFQMKRGKLTYRFQGKQYTAHALHTKFERKMKASSKARYKTVRIEAEINLETSSTAKPRWQLVVLILSAPKEEIHDNWVIFLTTDTDASVEQILEIYALRWSIEVYFKEVKQNFGFLAEQSGKYQVAYASIHLAAVRYLLIFEAMQRNGNISFGEQRDLQSGKLLVMSYANLLWGLFRAIITGVFEQLEEEIGKEMIEKLTDGIDGAVDLILNDALHMSSSQVRELQRAEAAGAI